MVFEIYSVFSVYSVVQDYFKERELKTIKVLTVLIILLFGAGRLIAATEMDIDMDNTSPTPVAKPTAVPAAPVTEAKPTVVASAPTVVSQAPTTQEKIETDSSTDDQTSSKEITIKPVVGQGVLKMKDVYKAGMTYYKQQDFAKAIRYLQQSLAIHDPYTPQYYYAEANAILGVIYQFHIIDKGLAIYYYQEALKIDPNTPTAKKHIGEVSGH